MKLILSLFKYLASCASYKKGSLFIASLAVSVPSSLGFNRFKSVLVSKFNTDDFVLNLMVALALFSLIITVVFFDNLTGVMKAKKLGEPLEPSKGLIGIFKLILYTMFIFIIMVFQAIAVVYGWNKLDSLLIVTLFTMSSLVILWEFKSIGDNVEVIFNKRFDMFNFIDRVTDLIEELIIDKIRNTSFCKTKKE